MLDPTNTTGGGASGSIFNSYWDIPREEGLDGVAYYPETHNTPEYRKADPNRWMVKGLSWNQVRRVIRA